MMFKMMTMTAVKSNIKRWLGHRYSDRALSYFCMCVTHYVPRFFIDFWLWRDQLSYLRPGWLCSEYASPPRPRDVQPADALRSDEQVTVDCRPAWADSSADQSESCLIHNARRLPLSRPARSKSIRCFRWLHQWARHLPVVSLVYMNFAYTFAWFTCL